MSACLSFNHAEKFGLCELSNVTAEVVRARDLVSNTDFVYHDITNWSWVSDTAATTDTTATFTTAFKLLL